MKNVSTLLSGAVLAVAIGNAFAAGSPGVEHNTQAFLQALEAGGGQPLESLSPQDARAVLVGAQASAKVDLSGVTAAAIDSARISSVNRALSSMNAGVVLSV